MSTLPAVPEIITPVERHTIAKLGEHAVGRLTYQVGVGASGTVYVALQANEGRGYFSPEWVALAHVQALLAPYQASGDAFTTPVLCAAYTGRSNNNAGFLAALLRHAGLLAPGEPPHCHRVSGDWEAWAQCQRQRLEAGKTLEAAPPADPAVKPRERRRPSK